MINFILHAWLKMLININLKFKFKYNNTFYLNVLMYFKCYEPRKFMFYFSFQYYKIIILCLIFFMYYLVILIILIIIFQQQLE